MTTTKMIFNAIENNDFESAITQLEALSKEERKSVLKQVLPFLKHDYDLACKPQSMVVLRRQLKPGKTYQDFHKAWLPPVDAHASLSGEKQYDYFHSSVRVINGIDPKTPEQFSTVLLSTASLTELTTEYTKYAKTEALRHEALKDIVEHVDSACLCEVQDSNYFG